jgi:hypothetical protein
VARSGPQGSFKRFDDDALLRVSHLWIEWQKNAFVAGSLRMGQRRTLVHIGIGILHVSTHNAAPSRDALVEHGLHDGALPPCAADQTHAVALPVRACPAGLFRWLDLIECAQTPRVVGREFAPPTQDVRQTAELLSTDRRRDIGQAIVEAAGS